jgi:hypothetical protein
MELSYYGFALFIFILLCAFSLLCKRLFRYDSNWHMQNMDEKEKKLLTLYSTMEDMMDEFNQTALAANEEMNRHIAQMRTLKAGAAQAPPPPAVSPAPLPPMPAVAAGDIFAGAASAAATDDFAPLTLPGVNARTERMADRPARILALHRKGMDRLNIAKELSVTLSEVDLVLGLAQR